MDIRRETVKTSAEPSSAARAVRTVISEVVYMALGLLLGGAELPLGALGAGFALLGALNGRHVFFAAAGLYLAVPLFGQPVILLGVYALTLAVRLIFGLAMMSGNHRALWEIAKGVFCEHVSMRMIAAAVGAFSYGLYNLLVGGFLYYYLFGTVLSMAVAVLGALLWYRLPELYTVVHADSISGLGRAAAVVSLLGVAVYSMRGFEVWGISVSAFAAMLLCLLMTARHGLAYGVATALAVGLGVSVSYAPLFVFGALCFAFFKPLSPLLGCLTAFAAGIAWGVYMDGASALYALTPALMSACLLSFVTDRLFWGADDKKVYEVKKEDDRAAESSARGGGDLAVARLDDAARRIKELCEGLSSLSEQLMDAESDAVAQPMEAEPRDGELCAEIGELGVLITEDLHSQKGKAGARRTYRADMKDYDADSARVYFRDSERTEAAASELCAISDYLAGIMAENDRDYLPDTALAQRITRRLRHACPDADLRVSVFGGRQKRIVIACPSAVYLTSHSTPIEREVAEACGFRVSASEPLEMEGETYLTFYRRPVLKATFAGRRRGAAEEGRVCGDSYGAVSETDDGRLYAFISDGMGSGRDAALMSRMCSAFLEKLLPVGGSERDTVDCTLRLLNSFLRYRNSTSGSECAATVDLGVLDLMDCKASFYKSGAAPTYIFRDGSLFKLRLRTVPVGIVREPDMGRINMELLPGDVIVMVSDGVTQGREECPELFEFLRSRLMTHSALALADAIISYCQNVGCTDDVSALVIKIDDDI